MDSFKTPKFKIGRQKKAVSDPVSKVLELGIKEDVFPGASLFVSKQDEPVIFSYVGLRRVIPYALPMEENTVFDLASLTKPLVTSLSLMKLASEGSISPESSIGDVLTEAPDFLKPVTLKHLLCHCGGLADWNPFYLECMKYEYQYGKKILRKQITMLPKLYEPGAKTLYSYIGFMFLEWIIELIAKQSLASYWSENFAKPLNLKDSFIGTENHPEQLHQDGFAATELSLLRGKVVQGEVHDDNAWFACGFSGHAGLFCTIWELYVIMSMIRGHYINKRCDFFDPDVVKKFLLRQNCMGDGRFALGWDMPSENSSSAGKYFSPNSVGHLGFTGTSVWWDLDKDIIVIFLSNRIHPSSKNNKIKEFRPILHNSVREVIN